VPPPLNFFEGSRIRPSGPVTWPVEISAFNRSRDMVGTASASARSSRQPLAVSATRASIVETPRFIG